MLWDIFCTVIDNHGDLGVCWRLAAELARRGETIRLWVDEASALTWMAPGGHEGVKVLHWSRPIAPAVLNTLSAADVVVEAFGCDINLEYIARQAEMARHNGRAPVWINLEYLSAEPWVERCHGLPSPVLSGPAAGWTKWFYYPGFTIKTGGLIRESGIADPTDTNWRHHARAQRQVKNHQSLACLFCYEPPALGDWLSQLQKHGLEGLEVRLLVMPGRPTEAVQRIAANRKSDLAVGKLQLSYLDHVPQHDFDLSLRASDFNLVRGEDSLVRALWAGQPLAWQIYPQSDNAHVAKLEAFLDWLQAPADLKRFHRVWNGLEQGQLPPYKADAWRDCVLAARQKLTYQDDLVTGLLRFCIEKR
jgi:uncharacterized repeat protein (TIGR03837 family)